MRIRTIKPEFFTHEGLYEAEIETGLPIRVAFAGLWCVADREGRFKWEPRRIGVQVLPYDGVDFSRVLDALTTRGFVVMYRVNDACFGLIPSFQKHQVINNRESESVLPDPSSKNVEFIEKYEENHASTTREARDDHAGQGEGKGREGNKEGKGKEGDGASAPRVRFVPPTREELNLEAAKIGLPSIEVDKFVAYYASNGWRVGKVPMKSWPHALAGWAARWRERSQSLSLGDNRYQTATADNADF
jgi:hypothetical protein